MEEGKPGARDGGRTGAMVGADYDYRQNHSVGTALAAVAAANANANEVTITCSSCNKPGPFSRRQKQKGRSGEAARTCARPAPYYDPDPDDESGSSDYFECLTDASAEVISKECRSLKSFSCVSTELTPIGLEKVLRANPNISILNLAENEMGSNHGQDAVNTISRYSPRLKVLRSYTDFQNGWLNDDTLTFLINAQNSHSKGSGIYLQRLGLKLESTLTKSGLDYALKQGLKSIELEELEDLDYLSFETLQEKYTGTDFLKPHRHPVLDGSRCELWRYYP